MSCGNWFPGTLTERNAAKDIKYGILGIFHGKRRVISDNIRCKFLGVVFNLRHCKGKLGKQQKCLNKYGLKWSICFDNLFKIQLDFCCAFSVLREVLQIPVLLNFSTSVLHCIVFSVRYNILEPQWEIAPVNSSNNSIFLCILASALFISDSKQS